MADFTQSFALELQDQTSGAAAQAALALTQLKQKIEADIGAIKEMRAQLRNLKGGTGAASVAARELRDRIKAQQTSLAATQAEFFKLGGKLTSTTRATGVTTKSFGDLLGTAQRMPGPLGALSGRLASVGGLVAGGGLIASGILAIVAAMGALVAATGVAVAALLRYGIAQSNARRNELLRLEGLTSLRRFQGLAAGSATELQGAIDRVSDSTGAARGDLERFTGQLHRAGLRGEQLNQALEAVAIAQAAQGDVGARRAAGMAAAIARTGGQVRRLTDDIKARLGPIATRQMLSVENQTRRLRENLNRLFDGLKIEKFLKGLQSVLSIFSQSTASGRALKAIVERLFQPIIDFASSSGVIETVKAFFEGMVLGALKLENKILRVENKLLRTFGGSSIFSRLPDIVDIAFAAGIATVEVFGDLLAASVVTLGAMGAATAALLAPWGAVGAAIGTAFAALKNPQQFIDIGKSIIDGLVNGLRNGLARITSTVSDIAGSIRNVFSNVLQIDSPSRVFADLGSQIPAGLTLGIESGTPEVGGAVESLVSPPGGFGGGGTSVSISIGDVVVNAQSEDPRSLAESFRDELARVLEGVVVDMGGAPA